MVIAFFCAFNHAHAQMPASSGGERYSYVRIHLKSVQDTERLQRLGIDLDHAHGKRHVFVVTFLQPHEIKRVMTNGFACDILIADWDEHYAARKKFSPKELKALQARSPVTGFKLGSMGGFLTFAEVVAELDSMRRRYPHLISQKTSLGKTIENRDIWMVKISSSPDAPRDKPEVFYNALIHAREPESMMVLMYFMFYLLERYGSDPEATYLLDNRELYFVPVVNPDGYVYNQTTRPNGGGLWRKNRRLNADGSLGVDLNRNFGFNWGFDDRGSSGNPANEAYRGAAPFSEPETAALRNFLRSRQFKAALNYHSYGNLMIYPFGYEAIESPDSLLFRDFAREATKMNGYNYGTGAQTVNYVANGDADDWMYGEQTEKPKIISSTIEVGNYEDSFWPSPSRIIPLAEENLRANLHTAWIAGAYTLPVSFALGKEFPQAGDTVAFSLTLHNKGISATASQLALAANSDSPYLKLLASQFAFGDLPSQGKIAAPANALRFVVQSGYAEGEEVMLKIDTHQNGAVVTRLFTFQLGAGVVLLADDAEKDRALWRFTGGWGRDSSFAYQGNFSFKDRPYANSQDNANAEMTLITPLDLTNITSAKLEFYTKYAIESDWDFGQVLISTDAGNTWQALQGTLTGLGIGTTLQPLFASGYDGIRHDWEKEEMRLNTLTLKKGELNSEALAANSQVLLKFRFRSDEAATWRGWYIDNIRVIGYPAKPTAVEAATNTTVPSAFSLEQNYPNPLRTNATATIRFVLSQREHVKLAVVDVLGREVATLVNGQVNAGAHAVAFDAKELPSGIYFYRLTTGKFTAHKKMLIIKAK